MSIHPKKYRSTETVEAVLLTEENVTEVAAWLTERDARSATISKTLGEPSTLSWYLGSRAYRAEVGEFVTPTMAHRDLSDWEEVTETEKESAHLEVKVEFVQRQTISSSVWIDSKDWEEAFGKPFRAEDVNEENLAEYAAQSNTEFREHDLLENSYDLIEVVEVNDYTGWRT